MINIEENFAFKPNDTIVIGCSSSPDSMALVDMLLKIRDKYNLSLIIAHGIYDALITVLASTLL